MSLKKILTKSLTTKTMTTSTLALKAELLKWICERHATNEPLDRKLLRDKAMELADSFGLIGFKCSEAWLTLFLKKHGFSPSLTNCNGPTFTDYRVWIDLLRSLITQYRHKDLFNVDELVMYSNFLPSRNRISIPFQQHGDCINQNHDISRISSQTKRIAVLLCCNSSGTEKLEPLISNPYVPEKSQDDTNENHRDISSTSGENFEIWLEKLNTKMANSHRNILLLLSRERIRCLHNFQHLSNVKLVFLPKDFPTQLRPLRGDVFHSVKMTYRRRYVEFVRCSRERTWREWSTKEIVESIFEAWKDVPQELVVSNFQRTKFREDESSLKIQWPEWDSLETGMSFRKFVTFDDELSDVSSRQIYADEMRFLSCTNNEHGYNLRRSRRETVELGDDRHEIHNQESSRVQKNPQNNDRINDVIYYRENDDLLSKDQSISRPKETRETSENNDFGRSRTSEFSNHKNTNDKSEIAPDKPETIDIDPLSSIGNSEIANISVQKIYESDGKMKITVDRFSREGKCPSVDFRPEVSPRLGETEKPGGVSMARGEIEERGEAGSAVREENVENFPRGAGPSGKEWFYPRASYEDANALCAMDFDDEEKVENDEELRLTISNAIEICNEIAGSNVDENPFLMNDRNFARSKRSRSCSGIDEEDLDLDEGPSKKIAKTDGDWAKRYETSFVFGPEVHENAIENVPNSSTNDSETNQGSSGMGNRSKMSQTGNDEIEKRCIFTLEASIDLPSMSYPKTND